MCRCWGQIKARVPNGQTACVIQEIAKDVRAAQIRAWRSPIRQGNGAARHDFPFLSGRYPQLLLVRDRREPLVLSRIPRRPIGKRLLVELSKKPEPKGRQIGKQLRVELTPRWAVLIAPT